MSIFTFGENHVNPMTGESLGKYYVEICTGSYEEDRVEILNRFGNSWSMQYMTTESAGVERYNLKKLDELPPLRYPLEFAVIDGTAEHIPTAVARKHRK